MHRKTYIYKDTEISQFSCLSLKKPLLPFFFLIITEIGDSLENTGVSESPGRTFTSQRHRGRNASSS